MQPDPLTVSLAAGALGGIAGEVVRKVIDAGGGWLSMYFNEHQPEAQAAANQNAADFIDKLADRIALLEAEAAAQGEQERLRDALSDPDFAALLHDSLIGAARTPDEDKHALLARVVSERLRYDRDSLVGLNIPLAVAAVPRLKVKHLRFLGLTTLITGIRPAPFPSANHDQEGTWYRNWLRQHLVVYHPMPTLSSIDFRHLESLACARELSFTSRDLEKILVSQAREPFHWPYEEFMKSELGQELLSHWEQEVQRATLTSAGELIGIYVHDQLTRMRTVINWE